MNYNNLAIENIALWWNLIVEYFLSLYSNEPEYMSFP